MADPNSSPLVGKRVLIVLGCLDLGGAERQAIHAASCLRRQGAEAEVWAFRPAGRAAALCDRLGIPWRYVPEPWGWGPLRWPLAIVRLARILRREALDEVGDEPGARELHSKDAYRREALPPDGVDVASPVSAYPQRGGSRECLPQPGGHAAST